jgi:hypothetical protein
MPARGDAGLEAVGLRHGPHGHEPAIAAAGDAEALVVDGRHALDRIDAGQISRRSPWPRSRTLPAANASPWPKLPRGLGGTAHSPCSSIRAQTRAAEPWRDRRRRAAMHDVISGSLPLALSGSSSQPCTSAPSLFQVMLFAVSGIVRPAFACVRSCQWPIVRRLRFPAVR